MHPFRPVLLQFPPLHDTPGGTPRPATQLSVRPMQGGLINDTFALGRLWVLQRLHPIFAAEVNLDIAALTPHLLRAGVEVPTLASSRRGQPWVAIDAAEHPDLAGIWRVMTRLPGRTLHRVTGPAQARSAGHLAARFHGGLCGVDHAFHFTRPGAHDTDKHLAALAEALQAHPAHRLHAEVGALHDELANRWQHWGRPPHLPTRIVHGDLKVSNLLFDDAGEAIAVLDLDTMAHGSLDVELGDALRSWCNVGAEDDAEPRFDADVCLAALDGYLEAAAPWITQEEVAALVPGAERIALELSMRFAADALNERYFGWNPQRAPSRGEHNLLRARNQLGLARDLVGQRVGLERALAGKGG